MNTFTQKVFAMVIGAYLGTIAGQSVSHYVYYKTASNEMNKIQYSDNLKKEWENYAKSQYDKIIGIDIFLPYSLFTEDNSHPLKINAPIIKFRPLKKINSMKTVYV
jgi:hypothetical protein